MDFIGGNRRQTVPGDAELVLVGEFAVLKAEQGASVLVDDVAANQGQPHLFATDIIEGDALRDGHFVAIIFALELGEKFVTSLDRALSGKGNLDDGCGIFTILRRKGFVGLGQMERLAKGFCEFQWREIGSL